MNAVKTIGECRVFLRAFEGLFFLSFALACIAVSWLVRNDSSF